MAKPPVRLFDLKKWLTLEDAARHLSALFGEIGRSPMLYVWSSMATWFCRSTLLTRRVPAGATWWR